VQLTPTVNFINVLRKNFSYKRRFSSYVLALSKNLYEKVVRKTLMKLTPVVNFSNILLAAFSTKISHPKKLVSHIKVLFSSKQACELKLTLEVNFSIILRAAFSSISFQL